jgi:hypothetical protein
LAVIGKPIPVLYPALASGDEIKKLPSAAIDYFADMRKSRFKKDQSC